ncbi:MAG: hypothetical protein J5367_05005 [Lachnospiraceae bacterium]|nr:hypothetical protein [Lachnospiraceae bacterium]
MTKKRWIITILSLILIMITAASAAVILNRLTVLPPVDKTIRSADGDLCIREEGRHITVWQADTVIWELDRNILAQDILFEDVDHDGRDELMILCWKRGRYGSRRPSWVKRDELGYSQHIYIYEVADGKIRPKWMASDIGMKAASWEFDDGVLTITDSDGVKTQWIWISWGLEKM